jgi:hypothetical protein
LARLVRVTGYDPFIAETELTAQGAGSFRLAVAGAVAQGAVVSDWPRGGGGLQEGPTNKMLPV